MNSNCSIQHDLALPALAWLLIKKAESVTIVCGDAVENTDSAVFEGAWSGPFGDFDFQSAPTVLGSGAIVNDGSVTLVPPSHTLEAIFYLRDGADLVASNSIAFLLTHLNVQPDVDLHFGKRFHSFVRGINKYKRVVAQTSAGPIERALFNDLMIDETGESHVIEKKSRLHFTDFSSYRDGLAQEMSAILANAQDSSRRRTFQYLTSISSGYDSPVGAVLATELGCTEGVTLGNARDGSSDSGEEVGKVLGLNVHVLSRENAIEDSGCPEAEFIATGAGGEDVIHRVFEPYLHNVIYVTGFLGSNWNRKINANREFIRMDSSGSTFNEFRLRTCFIHMPVPFIGGLELPSIHSISNSEEMSQWRLNSDYDRPISRRIVETAGVKRESFGQKKKATSLLLHEDHSFFSPEFTRHVESKLRNSSALKYKFAQLNYNIRKRSFRKLMTAARRFRKIRLGFLGNLSERFAYFLIGDYREFEHDHPRTFFEFQASLDVIRSRYERSRQPEK